MIYFSFRRIDKTYLKNKVLNAYHLEKQDYSPKNNTKKKRLKKQRGGSMAVEGKILIALNR